MMNTIFVALVIALSFAAVLSVAMPLTVYAGEVNPAHDADNGLGNEKSLGTCKQEANNDNACKK